MRVGRRPAVQIVARIVRVRCRGDDCAACVAMRGGLRLVERVRCDAVNADQCYRQPIIFFDSPSKVNCLIFFV